MDKDQCQICRGLYADGTRKAVVLPKCGHTICNICFTDTTFVSCRYCDRENLERERRDGSPQLQLENTSQSQDIEQQELSTRYSENDKLTLPGTLPRYPSRDCYYIDMTPHLRRDGLYLVKGENVSRPLLCCPNFGIKCIWYKPYVASSSKSSSSKGTTTTTCPTSESYAIGSRICYYLVVMAAYITMVTIGIVHWYDCPINFLIPPYLVCGGLGGATMAVHWMWRLSKGTPSTCEMVLFVLYALFHIVWFLFGCLWIYGVHPDYEHVYSPNYCQKTLYSFSFWLMHFSMVVLFSSFAWLVLSLLKVMYLLFKLRKY